MPLRYVAIGDSLSEGVGDTPWPDGTPRGWTDRLAARLATHHGGIEYANLAVRGYRIRQIVQAQRDAAAALAPDYVTVTAGMNDLLRPRPDFDTLHSDLVALVEPFHRSGTPMVFVPIPDLRRITPVSRLLERNRVRLNDVYRDLAAHHGVHPITDTTGTVFEDPRAWGDDHLHLTPLGHARLAQAAADLFGMPGSGGWAPPPAGPVPRATVRSEARWAREHLVPWVGRRLRGASSGDGRGAKSPRPRPVAGGIDGTLYYRTRLENEAAGRC
ncbi:SGNH/GDSL hydrolase family protein [Tomitella fengzijianii]|uniref:SGNH/GDSL hydrolase family protein n=1 Tax=Tomitella fengzijianii TaxID=2597660 RepID=A0A516X1H9_9ACTN|nr:SGNH/GDSL hydrolase family protein [Tomitella fengzijianii]QDQ96928.1 SGNH/GDSL hydrolase family protein [Tomitella fengzijianii]